MKLEKLSTAQQLPSEWDTLCDSYFQKKEFLHYCDQFNPCQQRYYLLIESGQLLAGAIVYTLYIDLFTFSKVKSPIKMQVIGIPVSVSASGIIGKKEQLEHLLQLIFKKERGLLLGLNLSPQIDAAPGIRMPVLPNIEMELPFSSWKAYLERLRSPYRRRVHRIQEKFKGVSSQLSSCKHFTKEHYQLYLAIMKRTPNKLEIIPFSFFQNLPKRFQLCTYSIENSMLCWHISCKEGKRFYFFFGGNNYKELSSFDSYFNNLFGILKTAINEKSNYLDLGQTAEVPKMRLGGQLVPKQMVLFHRNKVFFWLLKRLQRFIAYNAQFPAVKVFKTTK